MIAMAAPIQSNLLVPVQSATTDGSMTTSTGISANNRLSSSTTTTNIIVSSSCHCGNSLVAGQCSGPCEHDQQHMLQQHHTIYFDPYTTLPEGYVLHMPRWRRIFSKLHSHHRTMSSSPSTSNNHNVPGSPGPSLLAGASARFVGWGGATAKLTVRNLEEFFDPAAFDDEMDVFKDPKERENPYDNAKRRERVDQWIENLP